ncbi:Centrosome-associated, FAM110, C-terminal domain [Cinara cedri]|uniref:Centrosome-associated, FAM110, C-terminal domain n=1 Tax=Cinara cedri TaxID=506608 RepID=A0A5E4M112_9HEMI|nr:Centrosome-associated, FAM110, C-terminal domain [Cinara cedri]
MAALSSACYVRQQPGQPLKTLNVTNAILRTDKAPSSYRPQCTAKRKSAVELLQETKSLYVKSETVLDRKQELRRSLRSSGSSDKGSSSHDNASGNCCNWSSGSFTCLPPPKSPRLVAGCQRKSTADSQQLQNDLRRLLNADSKENLFEASSVFLDDVIVPPPVQYRRSVSHGQPQHSHHESEQEVQRNDDSYHLLQEHQQHQPCTSGPSTVCHKSMPDLTDVAAATVASTTAAVMAAANLQRPARPRRCRRSVSSGSVAAGDCCDEDNDGDDDDDIFDMYRGVPSPHGFGNKSCSRPDETDGGVVANNVTTCSFPDSLSLTSYKTDARWQQSAHGETGSSIGEENGGSVSPVKSTVSHGRGRRRRPQSGPTTVACAGQQQQLPPPPPPPVAPRRNHRNSNNVPTAGGDEFRGRPILRSKSDVGHGVLNRPLSLLSAGPLTTSAAAADEARDVYYDPEQLEKFFCHLGLDPDEYRSIVKNDSDEGSQVWFGDSNSSVGSVSGGSNNGYVNNNYSEGGPCGGVGGRGTCDVPATCGATKSGGGNPSTEQQLPSIVERNARIIKWLWNCRKANLQQQQTPPTPWST